jgi:hypothetical protein
MNRIDLTSENAIEQLKQVALSFGVGKDRGKDPTDDPYGDGIRTIGDLPCVSNMPQIPIRYVLDGVFAKGAISIVVGPSGCGKTTLLTAIAGAVADGKPFAGLNTSQAPVLHLDRENGLAIVQERLSRVRVRTSSRYKIWGGWAGNGAPYFDAKILEEFVVESDPKPLIIVDSLVAFHPGNENDAGETRAYFNVLRRLANLGAAIVLLHHNGKAESAQKYRGSSDIEAAADIAYAVRNSGGTRLDKVGLSAFKARFSVADELTFKYDNGLFTLTNERVGSSCDGKLQELLESNPGISAKALEAKAKAIEISRNSVRAFVDQGVKNGRITRAGTKNKGYTYIWSTLDDLVGII